MLDLSMTEADRVVRGPPLASERVLAHQVDGQAARMTHQPDQQDAPAGAQQGHAKPLLDPDPDLDVDEHPVRFAHGASLHSGAGRAGAGGILWLERLTDSAGSLYGQDISIDRTRSQMTEAIIIRRLIP